MIDAQGLGLEDETHARHFAAVLKRPYADLLEQGIPENLAIIVRRLENSAIERSAAIADAHMAGEVAALIRDLKHADLPGE